MTLFEATKTVKRWINGCETAEQVELLIPFIKRFLLPQFQTEMEELTGDAKKVMKYDIELAELELAEATINEVERMKSLALNGDLPTILAALEKLGG